MDNSFTYGVKLKMDLAFNNTNMKIAIVGNKVPNYETFKKLISPLLPKIPFQFISFQSAEIDKLTQRYATENNQDIYYFSPAWDKFNRSGGYIRNMEIIEFLKNFSKVQIFYLGNTEDTGLFNNLRDLCVCNGILIKKVEVKSQE